MNRPWTTAADIQQKVRRRWDDGSLLSALAADVPPPVFDIPLRGPKPGEIGEALPAVQEWITALEAGSRAGRHYNIARAPIGGRHFGRNDIPVRAHVGSYDQAWRLLGVTDQVATYLRVLKLTSVSPAVRSWVAANPLGALRVADDWEPLLAAYSWLDRVRGSGRFLRCCPSPKAFANSERCLA